VRQSSNYNREASLELSLAATKSLLSDYSLRMRQAEEVASRAVLGPMTDQQIEAFGHLVASHMDVRAVERSVQQQAILQATTIALNAALQAGPEEQKEMLTAMLRDLTSAVQHLQPHAAPQVQSSSK
jgi:hypothetical protein